MDIRTIKDVVAARYDVTVEEIDGNSQAERIARPRHIAMTLARRLTGHSYAQIGRAFGGKSDSAAIHAEQKVLELERQPVNSAHHADLTCQIRKAISDDLKDRDEQMALRIAAIVTEQLRVPALPILAIGPKTEVSRAGTGIERVKGAIDAVFRAGERLEQDRYGRQEGVSADSCIAAIKALRSVCEGARP